MPVDGNQLGLFRADGSDTMRAAAIDNYPRSGSQRGKVLDAIYHAAAAYRVGDGAVLGGLTDEEVQHRLNLGSSSQRPRRVELVDAGFVIDSTYRRPTTTGSQAIVWHCTDAGRAAWWQMVTG